MPPPRCHPPLRPCLHARRAFNGPRRGLSATHPGDSANTLLRVHVHVQLQRSVAWWSSILGRKPEPHSADVAVDVQDSNSNSNPDPSPIAAERSSLDILEPPVKATGSATKQADSQAKVADAADIAPTDTEGKSCQEAGAPSNSREGAAEQQLQELREQVQRLQALLERQANQTTQVNQETQPSLETTATQTIQASQTEAAPAVASERGASDRGIHHDVHTQMVRLVGRMGSIDHEIMRLRSPALQRLKIVTQAHKTSVGMDRLHNWIRQWEKRNASPATAGLRNYLDQIQSTLTHGEGARTPAIEGSRRAPSATAKVAEKVFSGAMADGASIVAKAAEGGVHQNGAQKSFFSQIDVQDASSRTSRRTVPTATPENKPRLVERAKYKAPKSPRQGPEDMSGQSLIEELFPELIASMEKKKPDTNRANYPKLYPPKPAAPIRATYADNAVEGRRRPMPATQPQSEQFIVLQLLHSSTELTEADFRRLVPKGKHIDTWNRNGEFSHVIPGRDPLTLERLPFYYLVFRSLEAALDYQNNAARLHKLSGLHRPTSIFSAIPPPPGFLEDGEDIDKVLSHYFLKPPNLSLNLNMVMQPYNPKLRDLFEHGGYKPIVPSVDAQGNPIYKVLLHIEGWESSRDDLHDVFYRNGYENGLTWPFHNGQAAFHRLRDAIDLDTAMSFNALSANNPRAATWSVAAQDEAVPDAELEVDLLQAGQGAEPSQYIISKLYNRWIVEFTEENAAQRFARIWNRRVIPHDAKLTTWRDTEEVRMINAEYLW